jgi:diacylglycerol O-acyltransferase
VTSYDGKLIVTLTSVPEIVPDPAFMAQCLRESFEDMKRAAQALLKLAKRRRNAKAASRAAS